MDGSYVVLRPRGAFDVGASRPAWQAWRQQIDDETPEQVVLDLAEVTFMDSAGLAVAIALRNRIRKYGGVFTLRGASEAHLALLRSAGLADRFPDAGEPWTEPA